MFEFRKKKSTGTRSEFRGKAYTCDVLRIPVGLRTQPCATAGVCTRPDLREDTIAAC